MQKFKDTTVRVRGLIYGQLQELWIIGQESRALNYLDHSAADAQQLARQMGLEQAADWIEQQPEKYEYAQKRGHWGLDTGKFDGNVICQRIGEIGTTALTNVPRTCIHHSPDGHEWGYGGSGPADLALDILNWYIPPSNKNGIVECFEGFSSQAAWSLHQQFKREFIAVLPREGGTIAAAEIGFWHQSTAIALTARCGSVST